MVEKREVLNLDMSPIPADTSDSTISIIPPDCFIESGQSLGQAQQYAITNIWQLRSADFSPGMQLTEIIACVNMNLDVIQSI